MRLVLLLSLCLLPLAGCLGAPEGGVMTGDRVQGSMTILDAASGEQIVGESPINFVVGDGQSGYGFQFERAFLGHTANESFVFERDPLEYEGLVQAPRFFGTDPAEPILLAGELERDRFVSAFGEPSEGMEFTPPLSFYGYRVTGVSETMVQYVALPEDGQENEVPHVGSILVTHVELGDPDDPSDDRMVQELRPDIGATFTVQPPSPFQPTTPLGLDPGSYKVIGSDEETLHFSFNPTQHPDLIGRELRFEIEIDTVVPGPGIVREPVDGNYGVRQSTQVNGHPDTLPMTVPRADGSASGTGIHEPEPGHDDGHS